MTRRSGSCATFTHWNEVLLFWIALVEGGQAQALAVALPPTQTMRGGGGVTRGGGVTMVGTRASFCGLLPFGGEFAGCGCRDWRCSAAKRNRHCNGW